jgi:hypothetical protein
LHRQQLQPRRRALAPTTHLLNSAKPVRVMCHKR